MEFEDTIINRRKFRVPEKIIRLDFWEKLKKERNVIQTPAAVQEEINADEQDAQEVCRSAPYNRLNSVLAGHSTHGGLERRCNDDGSRVFSSYSSYSSCYTSCTLWESDAWNLKGAGDDKCSAPA